MLGIEFRFSLGLILYEVRVIIIIVMSFFIVVYGVEGSIYAVNFAGRGGIILG